MTDSDVRLHMVLIPEGTVQRPAAVEAAEESAETDDEDATPEPATMGRRRTRQRRSRPATMRDTECFRLD